MSKIDDIVDAIYDPEIEKPEKQKLMRLCIKAWLRDATLKGIAVGRNDLALEIETAIKKSLYPGVAVFVVGKDL